MEVYTSKREKIFVADTAFSSSGGEGEIRKIISGLPRFNDVCVKIYYRNKRTRQREDKIKYMVANPPTQVRGNVFLIGWPLDYVTDTTGKFIGFIMPLAFSSSNELGVLITPKLSKKLEKAWYTKYDRTNGKSALISRLKLICNIAIPIHILHSTGKYVLKDFKPGNVLITPDGHITLVDIDSIQICEGTKLLFPGAVATPGYIPPEYYTKNIGKVANIPLDKSWDSFAIGIVFYQVLLGLHPYAVTPWIQKDADRNEIDQNISLNLFPFGPNGHKIKGYPELHNKFKKLPKNVQDLFLRTFSDNINQRPGAEDWGKCIHEILVNAGNIPILQPGTTSQPPLVPKSSQPLKPNITPKLTPGPTLPSLSYPTKTKRRKVTMEDIEIWGGLLFSVILFLGLIVYSVWWLLYSLGVVNYFFDK